MTATDCIGTTDARGYPVKLIHLSMLAAIATNLVAATTIEQYRPHDFTYFDVDLRGEFTGPDGTDITVPGFYAGGNNWKIRFSPAIIGRWSMTTISPVAALNGRTETDIQCTKNLNPAIHGGLLVDPVNRHHFIYQDGTRYFLMGYEADWLWGADMRDLSALPYWVMEPKPEVAAGGPDVYQLYGPGSFGAAPGL